MAQSEWQRCHGCGVKTEWWFDDGAPEVLMCRVCTAPSPRQVEAPCPRCGRVPTSMCVGGRCPTFEVGNRSYPSRG